MIYIYCSMCGYPICPISVTKSDLEGEVEEGMIRCHKCSSIVAQIKRS